MSPDHNILRILDASLNRAAEGLRVVEDYVRFVLDDAHLTSELKQLRHDLTAAATAIAPADRHSVRDTQHDVGTTISTSSETQRADAWQVCQASLERVKQSLRSLEEFGKVIAAEVGARFETLRYRLYTLEAALGCTEDALARLTDVRLYALIDAHESEVAFIERATQLINAGVDAIQLRDKRLSDRELIARARSLQDVMNRHAHKQNPSGSLPLAGRAGEGVGSGYTPPLIIINDRPDVAAIADADGVHLGQDDMSVKDARAIVGPRKLIGVSTHSLDQARAAVLDGANYIGVGPTFPSTTKDFDAFPGTALLRQVAAEIRLPAFAIGGITQENVGEALAAGFSRIAVSSAISKSSNPLEAASKLCAALQK